MTSFPPRPCTAALPALAFLLCTVVTAAGLGDQDDKYRTLPAVEVAGSGPASPPSGATPGRLTLMAADARSALTLERLCSVIMKSGRELPYSEIRLLRDTDGKYQSLAKRIIARGELGPEEHDDAERLLQAEREIARTKTCLRRTSTREHGEFVVLSWEDNQHHFFKMNSVDEMSESRTLSSTKRDPAARELAWRALNFGKLRTFELMTPWVDVMTDGCTFVDANDPSNKSDSRIERRDCIPIGKKRSTTFRIAGSSWIPAKSISWAATLVCEDAEPIPIASSDKAISFDEDFSVDTVEEIAVTPLVSGACKVDIKAWPKGFESLYTKKSSAAFRVEAEGILVAYGQSGWERITSRTFDLVETAHLLGVVGESTNRRVLEGDLWDSIGVSGRQLIALAVEFERKLRMVQVERGFGNVVDQILAKATERPDFLGRAMFEREESSFFVDDASRSTLFCKHAKDLLNETATELEIVSSFPHDWYAECESIVEELAPSAIEALAGIMVEPAGNAPVTAVPSLKRQDWALLKFGAPVFSSIVDKPFRRNEYFKLRAILKDGSATESIPLRVHQTAAPVDIRIGTFIGFGALPGWRRDSEVGRGTVYKQYFEPAVTLGVAADLLLFRDLLGLRLNVTKIRSRTVRDYSSPFMMTLNVACASERLTILFSRLPSINSCSPYAVRVLAGYDPLLPAVVASLEADAGIRIGDLIEVRPTGGIYSTWYTRDKPVPREESFSDVGFGLQVGVAATLLDPTTL
jgi:hypothetical protein